MLFRSLQMFIAMTIWVILHAVVFYANNQYLKAWMDIVRAIIGIGMTILWMGLNREKKSQEVHEIITLNEMKMATTGFGQNSLLEKLHQVMQTELLYLNPNLRLTDLQSKLYTNRTYLSRAINEVPGQSFYSIVLNYRIEYAKKLLITEPSKKLDEIAILSGFSSRSYFSRIFKEEVGITPSKYRELIEQKVG